MDVQTRMTAKLLAQIINDLSRTLDETLCIEPDRKMLVTLLRQAQDSLHDLQQLYDDPPRT